MKRIHLKNGTVDSIELNITDKSDKPSSYVVADNVEVFGGYTSNGDGSFTSPVAYDATIEEVKQEAGRRINALFPDYKQRNYIARQSELDRIETGTMRDNNGTTVPARSLTSEEIAELVAIKSVWDWILAVRVASAAIEASPPKTDQLETDNRWPDNPS